MRSRESRFRVGGASWVSFHHGGGIGIGIGYSQHAGQVIVCDGTPEADKRIERVHDSARQCVVDLNVKIPMKVGTKR